jgi:hypothetical protein
MRFSSLTIEKQLHYLNSDAEYYKKMKPAEQEKKMEDGYKLSINNSMVYFWLIKININIM